MSEPYEEILAGETYLRLAPGTRHEVICTRLHQQISLCVQQTNTTKQLPPRSLVQVSPGNLLRPDLALMTVNGNKLWLAAEIISSDDHRTDTVAKKMIYEEVNIPRLWMIDPRYDNVEIYHSSPYGLVLKQIMAGRELLNETLLPEFSLAVADLFADPMP